MDWNLDDDGYFCLDTESARLLHVAQAPDGWAWAVMNLSYEVFADEIADSLNGAKRAAEAARPVLH